MKRLVNVTLITAGISVFYIALKVILDITDIGLYLRTWADVLGKVTSRVAASGRKHWSDVGTKEYREITETEQNS